MKELYLSKRRNKYLEYTLISQQIVQDPLEQVLLNRGIEQQDIQHYLNPTEEDEYPPTDLMNIEEAAKLLIKHLSDEKGHVFVQVDSDADGYTSSALLLNYIYVMLPTAVDRISYDFHSGKQHGLNMDKIPAGTSLVVAPVSSSNDYEIHKQLRDNGIDVLVLDHHQADKISEYACIVNNQLCDYPNKALSGVGIVYKLCQYLDQLQGTNNADLFLDILALGLVGDMVDLRSIETRYLVSQGLQRSHLRNPFMLYMAERNKFQLGEGDLTPIGLAFYIVPLVNAVTRVGTQDEKRLLFDSMLEWKAFESVPSTKRGHKGEEELLVEQAVRTCTNVKNRQTRDRDANAQEIERIIEENNLLDHKVLVIQLKDFNADKNIVGLIANELMSKYKRPVALLNRVEKDGQISWEGSARGYSNPKLSDFRQFCLDSNLVKYAEGHPSAFGLGISDEKIEDFISYCDTALQDVEFSPSYKVDFIYSYNDIGLTRAVLSLGNHKELWGQEVSEPLLVVENIPITKNMITLMSKDKNPTLKIRLPNDVACIKFKSNQEEFESLYSENGCITVTIIGKPEINYYNYNSTPQIIIIDMEVVNRQQYYF